MMTVLWGLAMSHGLVGGVQAAQPKQAKPPPTARTLARDDSPKESYTRQVKELVQKQWNLYRSQRPDGVDGGSVRTEFYVNKQGKVEGLHVVDATESHAILTGMTLRAIRDTTLPPMPDEVSAALHLNDAGLLKIGYDAVILPFKAATTPPETPGMPPGKASMLTETPSMPPGKPIPKALAVEDDEPETPKGRYIRQVVGLVEKKWHAYRLKRRDSVTYGSLKLAFYVNKMGKVEKLHVIDDKKSNEVLTEFTLQAIRDAEIPPMPADVIPLLPMNDRERLKVEYNVLIY